MIANFIGNSTVVKALERTIEQDRIPQTLLFYGSEGVGKATLARRVAAAVMGGGTKIERDDLHLPENRERIEERKKLTSEKRSENPLLFSSHPDFVTFPPDGPLRQVSIHQMRALKERAAYLPLQGNRRVFLIDHLDRANEHAANSLLKTLEEPPEHLILIATAENVFDLLPTIRSRAVAFHLSPLSNEEMGEFVLARNLDEPDRRVALSNGSPGTAVSLDLQAYDRRRDAMLALLGAATRATRFSVWAEYAERLALERSEKLDDYLTVTYSLLEDILVLREGQERIRNADVRERLAPLAERVSFDWLRAAVKRVDEIVHLLRRSIQKSIALDALVLELRDRARAER